MLAARYDEENGSALWYSFIGDGRIVHFKIGNPFNIGTQIYTACGAEYLIAEEDERILTIPGQKYLLRIFDYYSSDTDFSINFKCFEPAPSNFCELAEVVPCREGSITIEPDKHFYASQHCTNSSRAISRYIIEGNDKFYEFDQSEEFRFLTYRILTGDCANQECLSSAYSEDFTFFAKSNTTYYLNIEFFFDDIDLPSNITINYRCIDPAPNDFYQNREALTCGSSVDIDFTNAHNHETVSCRTGEIFNTLWYSAAGDGQLYHINTDPSDQLIISTYSIENDELICLGNERIYPSNNPFQLYVPEGQEYVLGISSYQNRAQTAQLEISCSAPDIGQTYLNPINISCNQMITNNGEIKPITSFKFSCNQLNKKLWYTFEGINKFKNIDIKTSQTTICMYEEINGSLTLLHTTNTSVDFFAYENKTYVFSVERRSSNFAYEFSIDCYDDGLIENDNCFNSLPLVCGETLVGSLDGATIDFDDVLCGNSFPRKGIWYHFEGNDSVMTFNMLGQFISIYEGTCEELICLKSLNGVINNFQTEKSKSYKLNISSRSNETNLETSCFSPLPNDLCNNAIELNCGDSFRVDLTKAVSNEDLNNCQEENVESIWYKTIGTGDRMTLSVDNSISSWRYNIRVFKGDCLTCQEPLIIYENEREDRDLFTFFTEEGVTYTITFEDLRSFVAIDAVFRLDCESSLANADFESAELLNCLDTIDLKPDLGKPTSLACYEYSHSYLGAWYQLKGDGRTFSLDPIFSGISTTTVINIYTLENDELVCFKNGEVNSNTFRDGRYTFDTESGKTYYLYLSNYNSFRERKLVVQCHEPSTNDSCDSAQRLDVRGSINSSRGLNYVNILGAVAQEQIEGLCENNKETPPVWYKTIGNGQIIDLTLSSTTNTSLLIEVYTGTCDNINCELLSTALIEDNDNYSFHSLKDINYFIRISGLQKMETNIVLEAAYKGPQENSICASARLITCNETVVDSLDFTVQNEMAAACTYLNYEIAKWYSFTGDGGHYKLILHDNISRHLRFFTDDCNELTCLTVLETDGDFILKTELDKTYYIAVRGYRQLRQYSFSFTLQCLEEECGPFKELEIEGPNVLCKNDLEVFTLSVSNDQNYSYKWSVPHSIDIIGPNDESSVSLKKAYRNNSDTEYLISLTYSDTCGRSQEAIFRVETPSNYACSLMKCAKESLSIDNPLLQEFDPQNTYKVQSSIQSNAHVDQSTMYFHAGQEIILDPNFEISSGKLFEAMIEECVKD